MFTYPERLRRLYATPSALLRRPSGLNLNDVRTMQARVFKERDEPSPRRILLVPSIVRLLHPLHIEIFLEHGLVLFDEPRRELVLIVQHLPMNPSSNGGDLLTLLLVVVQPVFLPREFLLLTTKTLVFVFNIKPIHSRAVAGVYVAEDAKVDAEAVARIERVHGGFLDRLASLVSSR